MQEFFFTILSIWLIIKLFSAFSGTSSSRSFSGTTHNHFYQQQQQQRSKPEGTVRVENKKSASSKFPTSDDDYVEFEEIKD